MTNAAESSATIIVRQAMADLAPFPGRAGTAWRTALMAAIVAAVAMMFELPEAAISCYLVAFLMKPDESESCAGAIAIVVLITVIVALLVPLSQWTVDSPGLRLLVMAAISFAFLFLGAASKLGEIGGVIALIIAVVLSLLYKTPGSDIATSGLRYAWEMVVMPMAMMVAFNLCLGRSTVAQLRDTLRQRLVAARQAVLDASADNELWELLREGNGKAATRAKFVRLLHLASSTAAEQIARDVWASYQLMLAVSGLSSRTPEAVRSAFASQISAAITALDAGKAMPPPPAPLPDASRAEHLSRQALAIMAGAERAEFIAAPKEPFFAPDAFNNPEYQRYALKTTAAAMLCYVIYAGINWQGIHTAMITCYVASLGTTAETIHKLQLRILGCLIGATMGWGAILFLMPHMDSIGHLMVLLFAGTFIAAWVSNGNERISYAGLQIALAFFLCVLHGFGPSIDLETVRDRIIGILVGNTVVYLISTLILPVGIEQSVRANLSKALAGLARLAATSPDARSGAVAEVADVEQLVGRTRDALFLLPLEPRALQGSKTAQQSLRRICAEIESLKREIYLSPNDLSDLSKHLACLTSDVLRPAAGSQAARQQPLDTSDLEVAGETKSEERIETYVRRIDILIRAGERPLRLAARATIVT
jgi:multidrug resistance protein MdtO